MQQWNPTEAINSFSPQRLASCLAGHACVSQTSWTIIRCVAAAAASVRADQPVYTSGCTGRSLFNSFTSAAPAVAAKLSLPKRQQQRQQGGMCKCVRASVCVWNQVSFLSEHKCKFPEFLKLQGSSSRSSS